MKKILSILAAVIVAAMFYASCGISYRETVPARIVPTHLRTDLMEYDLGDLREGNPLIESQSPRFSWVVPSIGNNTKQTAYRILVDDITATDSIVRATYGDYPYRCVCWVVRTWDSGWIKSSQSVAVPYEGPRLKPGNKYSWRVQLRLESKTGINKVMKETSLCQTAAFKTASELKEYATPSYPILAKEEAGKLISGGIYDFEKAAFGKLRLTLKTDSDDSVTVIIGERLKDGRIEHTPRVSSVVYDEIGLRLKPGVNTYIVEPNRDGRNTGPMAVPTQDYVGVVAPFRYCTIEGVSPAGGPSGAAPGGDIAVVKAEHVLEDMSLGDVLQMIRDSDAFAKISDFDFKLNNPEVTLGRLLDLALTDESFKELLETPVTHTTTVGDILDKINAEGLLEQYKDVELGRDTYVGELVDKVAQNETVQEYRDQSYTFNTTVGDLVHLIGEDHVKDILQNKVAEASYVADYDNSWENIVGYWLVLIAFVLVFAILSTITLEFIDKDKR